MKCWPDYQKSADFLAAVKSAGGWKQYWRAPRIELVRLRSLCDRGRAAPPSTASSAKLGTLQALSLAETIIFERLFGPTATRSPDISSPQQGCPKPHCDHGSAQGAMLRRFAAAHQAHARRSARIITWGSYSIMRYVDVDAEVQLSQTMKSGAYGGTMTSTSRMSLLVVLLAATACHAFVAPTRTSASRVARRAEGDDMDSLLQGLQSRVQEMMTRQATMPIVVLDSMLPGQRIKLQSADPAFREMIEWVGVKASEDSGEEQYDDDSKGVFGMVQRPAAVTIFESL